MKITSWPQPESPADGRMAASRSPASRVRPWALWLVLAAASAAAAQTPKKKVESQSDLPRFSYPITGTASALVQSGGPAFDAFAAKVGADLATIGRDYEIEDRATRRDLLSAELSLQEIAGDDAAALQSVAALRALEDKPAAKLMTGLSADAWLRAALETKGSGGDATLAAFRIRYRAAIQALPWAIVQDPIKRAYLSSRIHTRSVAIAAVMTEEDHAVSASGALDADAAWDLVETRADLVISIPLNHVRSQILGEYIAAHDVPETDIWQAREVTLTASQHLTPVVVAIWDSGIDVRIFPQQLFTDPVPTASGTHGLAFNDDGSPSTTWIYPLSAEQEATYPKFRSEIKGRVDLEHGLDSPDAQAMEQTYTLLPPEKLHDYFEQQKVLGFYMHGTHCAGIAVRGNPAARLVVARFDDQLPDLPFPPTAEWARRLGDDFRQMADYFNSRHVRVVNMSWGDTPQEFEAWLDKTGGGADSARRKQDAAQLYAQWRAGIEAALRRCPGVLFVTAAGNSDSDAGFGGDVPASLHLPNLIAVGAVNSAGEETSFTSYGDTVLVDADGYEVESFVPGGDRVKESGTSMASPNVVNLAAKLFALDPALTPAQVIDLIRRGATTSADGRRHLIDERKSVALLPPQP
jgi:subtilisin family serine protease